MARPELTVDRLMKALDHPMNPELQRLRELVLAADAEITEQVKWNGPSFCWKGDDRVTANVRGKDAVMLVFHRGAKARPTEDFSFEDPTGLMQWSANDRAVVTLKSMDEIDRHADDLTRLVQRWMAETE
jgi:hypothetical protein